MTFRLTITGIADQDLDDLYSEGFRNWGEAQADRYFDGLLAHFDQLCVNPRLYPAVDDIRAGYRRSIYRKHSVFFVILDDRIEIRAVIKRQNIYSRV